MSDRLDIATRRVVYEMPGQDAVSVRRGLTYEGASGERLSFELYEPPGRKPGIPSPAVVFVTGYNDLGMQRIMGCKAMETASFVCWGQLVAIQGLAGITYECRQPAEDARAILAHVRAHASDLHVDPERIAIWACSGHGPNAVALLMDVPGLAGAALCYPYLLDLDGHTGVAQAAAQFRFVTPAAGRPLTDIAADVPVLIARAGRDEMPGLNAAIDRAIEHALRANVTVSLVNHPTGPHAFDIIDPSPASRLIVRQVLGFLQAVVRPEA